MLLALAGCVEETRRPSPGSGSRTPATLPEGYVLDGPIASPAFTARNINASVRAVIEPLGTVPFDGLVLPLVSPDATRLVTQTGSPPTWGTTLASPDAGPALRTRLEVYDITQAPPQRIRLESPLEPGVLLGRSADERGFLVEEPRPDGARRIGIASWTTGTIDWLADEPGVVFSGGVLTPTGDLIASRRDIMSPDSALWSRKLGELASDQDVAYTFPFVSGIDGELGVLELTPMRGTTLTWWTYASGQPILRARRRLSNDSAMIGAYQATDPFRGLAPGTDEARPGVLVFSAQSGRVVFFEPTHADLVPLVDKSISGAWVRDDAGWSVLLTTPEGLVHQRLVSSDGVWEALPAAKVLADVYVPRATRSAERPYVLIGPSGQGATRRLSIVGLRLLFDNESAG